MGNQLCAPWRKGYADDERQWTPRKDSHLLRLWAEIFEVQEENGDICWGRVSDDVVPVNITCIQNQPSTVFQITAYSRHVEKIFDVRIIQPGTRVTQASECFVHWKDSKCDREWGLNFTTPTDARCFRDCCSNPVNHNSSRKTASSGSLRANSPKRGIASGGGTIGPSNAGTCPGPAATRRSASNPTSPVGQPRRAISSPEELAAVQDAIDAGFVVSGLSTGGGTQVDLQSAMQRHYGGGGDVSAIATAPRVHRQQQRVTPRAQSVFGGPVDSLQQPQQLQQQQQQQPGQPLMINGQQYLLQQSQRLACENVYSQVTRPTSVSQTPRRDDPPTYATAAASCSALTAAGTMMHQPIAEREIPYDQYASILRYSQYQQQVGNSEQIYSTCRVTSRIANAADGSHHVAQSQSGIDTVDGTRCLEPTSGPAATAQELRQFSREPTVINFDQLSTYDVSGTQQRQQSQDNGVGVFRKPSALKSSSLTTNGSSSILPVGMSAGFDSNTLKRMLQTLPEATSPIGLDRRHNFDDDDIDDDDNVGDDDDVNHDAGSQSDLAAAIISDLRRTSPPPTVAADVLPDSPPPPLPIDIMSDVVLSAETISGILRPLLMSATTSPQSDDGVKSDPPVSTDGGPEKAGTISVNTIEQRTTNIIDDQTTNKMTSPNDRNTLNEIAAKPVGEDTDVTASDDHHLQQSQLIEAPVAFGGKDTTASTNWNNVIGDFSDSRGRVAENGSAIVEQSTTPSAAADGRTTFTVQPSATKLPPLPHHLHQQQQQQQQQQLVSDISESESAGTNSESEVSFAETNIYFLPYESQAAYASKSTAVRKTGWLSIQNWLFHKMVSIVVAPTPTWNRYWVCLKGTTLLFYLREQTTLSGRNPRHALVVSGSVAHRYPEYTQKDHVFALSTAFGDAYLVQADSDAEMDSWIEAIHLSCAASFARHLGRDGTAKLLRAEIHKLENSIDLDLKMKKMAGMQTHMANDPASRQALERQMVTWDENLEKLHTEQFQLRCYLAAIQGSDLPNTKALMSSMSKATRAVLANVGAGMAVSAFHALVSARTPLTMTGTLSQVNRSQGHGTMSTFKADTGFKLRPPRSPRPYSAVMTHGHVGQLGDEMSTANDSKHVSATTEKLITVYLPDNQSIVAGINDKTTVQDLLEFVCSCCHLNQSVYFIRFNMLPPGSGTCDSSKIPDKSAVVLNEEYHSIELCAKLLFQTELVRTRRDQDFGFSIEAKVSDGSLDNDELCVIVSDVTKGGPVALKKGLQVGDELLVLNGLVVSQLDLGYVETLLDELDAISLTVRSCRSVDRVCQQLQSGGLTGGVNQRGPAAEDGMQTAAAAQRPQPAVWLQQPNNSGDFNTVSNGHIVQNTEGIAATEGHRTLTDSQRICKVIVELIETERQYVRDVNCLIDWYLEPLKAETFLSGEDIERLFGNIQEIVQFQKQFLHSLEQAVEQDFPPTGDVISADDTKFKSILLSLSSAFLYYAHHFKLYSSFCASHSKAQKVLLADSNIALQEFLRSRNPNQQHSATLESFLIKPIQRILKYPLLLRQLTDLTDVTSDVHAHLCEALHGMEAVAEHINEMQKIYDEYGNVFDELSKHYKDTCPQSKGIDLNVGELQMYGTVNWLNAGDELGKVKKGTELLTLLFIFKTGVVLMAQERVKGKRKPRPVPGRSAPLGVDSPDVARYKTAIPVDQLQVRAMAGDAHECHGIWEMVHLASDRDYRSERIFQFASSQEARRDFIRTIQQTIRDFAVSATVATPSAGCLTSAAAGGVYNSSSSSDHVSATATSTGRRPETLATNAVGYKDRSPLSSVTSNSGQPRFGSGLNDDGVRQTSDQPAYDSSASFRSGGVAGGTAGEPTHQTSYVSDLTHSNLAEHTAGGGNLQHFQQQPQLGSQSTLASDRGGSSTGAARLLHTSHDPVHFSSQSAAVNRTGGSDGTAANPSATVVGGGGSGSGAGGGGSASPIWKRRYAGGRGGGGMASSSSSHHSPASNDDARDSDGSGDGGSSTAAPPREFQKQRVTFRVPPSAYIETEDTDC